MLTSEQLAARAFSAVDKNLYETIFFSAESISKVEMSGGFVIIALIVAVFILFMYLDRENGFTPGHHSRQDGAFWLAAIIILVPFFLLKPSSENIALTEKSLQERMIAKVPEVVAAEIKKETNIITKLQIIIDEVDSSGRLYYYTNDNGKVDTNSRKYGNMIHHYIDTHNYQAEYVADLKTIEKNYNKDIATAKFLQDVFEKGNIFVEKDKKKAQKYKKDIKLLKEEGIQRDLEESKEAERLQREVDSKVAKVVPVKIGT